MANTFVSPTSRSTGNVISADIWNADVKANEDELADFHGVLVFNTAGTNILTGADRAVPLDAEEYDTDAFHGGTDEFFTVPAGMGGYYHIYANLTWNAGADANHQVFIKVNNAHKLQGSNPGVAGQVSACAVSGVLHLAAGDHVDIEANTDVSRTLYTTDGATFAGMYLVNRDG